MRLKTLILALIGFYSAANAQPSTAPYKPIEFRPVHDEVFIEIQSSLETRLEGIEFDSKDETKLAKEFVEGLYETLKYKNDKGSLSDEDPISQYLQGITDKIVVANKLPSKYFHVFLSVDDVPNAANYGEGIIVFNLGLLSRLNTEGEIAFILAHEISHDLKDHVFQGIKKKAIALESKAYKNKVKEIEDMKYNQRAAMLELYYSYTAAFNEHGRGNELTADSLGLILMQKAGYKIEDAITAIDLLDHSDALPDLKIDYSTYFNFRNFPFDQKWLEKQKAQSLGGNLDDYVFPDSLKTHPSCKARDSALRVLAKSPDLKIDSNRKIDYFPHFESCRAEQINYFRNTGQFSLMLYYSLYQSQVNPTNSYYTNSIGNALYGIYTAQYAHKFSMAVPFPTREMQPTYAELLGFLHKLNLTRLQQLFQAYSAERIAPEGKEEYADLLHALSSAIDLDPEDEGRQEIVEEYESKYGESPYTTYLKSQFPEPNKSKKRKKR